MKYAVSFHAKKQLTSTESVETILLSIQEANSLEEAVGKAFIEVKGNHKIGAWKAISIDSEKS